MPEEPPDYYVEEVQELNSDLIKRVILLQNVLQPTHDIGNETNLLEKIVNNPSSALLVIRNSSEIAGTVVINLNYKLHYIEARLDEVVVDPAVQGHGLGTKLMQGAIDWCRDNGAQSIELTSRPSRVAANNLYLKLGFELRETNVYKLSL